MKARVGVLIAVLGMVLVSPPVAVAGSQGTGSTSSRQAAGPGVTPRVARRDTAVAVMHEDPSLRTSSSRSYRSGSSITAVMYPGPVNYQDAKGSWQQIDDTLTPTSLPGYAYQNRANAFSAYLPASLGQQGVVLKGGGRSFEFAIQGAAGTGSASGNVDTFADALPATTVADAVTNAALEETLTLRSSAAPNSFQYLVKADADLVPTMVGTSRVDFVAPDGTIAFSFAAPEMRDSSGKPAGTSRAIDLVLGQRQPTGQPITLAPDPVWLSDHARRWPIVIDPTVTVGTVGSAIFKQESGADQDCVIQNNFTTSACSGQNDFVGHTSTFTNRTLLQFNVQNSIPHHVTVVSADLGVYLAASQSGGGVSVDASQVTTPWTTGATWTTSNGTTSWTAGGAIASPPAWTNTTVGPTAGWYHWYFTRLAQGWVDGSTTNVGFLLKASSEGTIDELTFRSSQYSSSTFWPFLQVTYQLGIGEKRWFKFAAQPLTDRLDVAAQVGSGNLIAHEHLFSVKGTGQDLRLDLYFNNLSPAVWDFGQSWVIDTGYDVFLAFHPDGINLYYTTGEGYHFVKNANGTYTTPPGLDATLTANTDGTYTLRFRTDEVYDFSSTGTFTSAVDKDGNRTTFAYDANGALSSITDTQGRVTTFGYTTTPTGCTFPTSTGLVSQITDPAGRRYQFGYGSSCALTSYTDPSGGVTSFGYDANLDLTGITDPSGNASTFTYDSLARIASATYPSASGGYTTTFTYNTGGSIYNTGSTAVKDGDGGTTTFAWDGRERVTQMTDPAGNATTTSWTADNSVSQVHDPTGAVSNAGYDASNDVNSATSPTGATASGVYGNTSHPHLVTSSKDPQGNSATYAYDTPGNLTKATDPLGHATQYAYNTNGTRSSTTDVNGDVTTYQYDSVGNLTGVFPVGPDFTYDGISRATSATDGKSQKTTYSYDALDRPTKTLYADGTSVSYTYNAADDVTSMTDPTGTTTYTYDRLNRLSGKTLPSGQSISYAMDANGNLTSETDSGGTTTFAYNFLNELTSIKDPSGATTSLGYDADYRETSVAYPNGVTVAIGRDSSGAITGVVARNSLGTTLLSQSYSYVNPASGTHTAQRYSTTDQAGNVTIYTYDGLNRLTGSTTKNSGGTVTDSRSYTYDSLGNRLSQTINGVNTTYSYNLPNRTMTVGSLTYTYDADGNLVSRSDGLSATYNGANNTTSMTPPGGSAIAMTYTGPDQSNRVTAGTGSFVYDPRGLSQRTSGGSTVYELRDRNGQLLSERSSAGTNYVIAGIDGSTIGLTDSSGNLVSTWAYDPWGNVTGHTGTVSTPFLFQGAYLDSSTGLYKMQTRFYDPATGRWLQPGLNAVAPTQSRYAFQLNDSTSLPAAPPTSP